MNDLNLAAITHRLDRLEHENRRWRRGAAGVVIVAVSFALMGQAMRGGIPKVVEGERFVLRDTSGRVLASLGLEADGSVGLLLLDSAGKTRAAVGVTREGSPVMALSDQAGKARVSLTLSDGPGLSLRDQAGRTRLSLSVLAEGSGIYVWDQGGRERAVLLVASNGSQVLGFRDQAGNIMWKAP